MFTGFDLKKSLFETYRNTFSPRLMRKYTILSLSEGLEATQFLIDRSSVRIVNLCTGHNTVFED